MCGGRVDFSVLRLMGCEIKLIPYYPYSGYLI